MPARAGGLGRADFRRHLVAAGLPPVPDGCTVVDSRITQGLPHAIALEGEYSLLLVVPTGLARAWLAASPTAVVTSSRPQLAPVAPKQAVPAGAPARLVVLRAGRLAGAIPLAAGASAVVPEADFVAGTRIEVFVREWDLRAGSLRGPGDVGSRVSVAWRRIDRGAATFDAGSGG
jgi:hypothetical protein